MIIGTIVNGVVIDHIPAGRGMEIYRYLGLEELDCEVALIKNAPSVKMGKKDIVKVSDVIDLDYDILGFIDPKITVNIIQNGEKVRKIRPQPPERITGILKCKNPRCITSIEQGLDHIFFLSDPEKEIYRCKYCEEKYRGSRNK